MKVETGILISGTGGQGIIAAGEFLSAALFRAGYEVINARSYGSEARGGSCKSEVLVSDSEIYDLQLAEPDVLIALSMPAFRRYQGRAKSGALVIVDSAVLEGLSKDEVRQDIRLNPVPATEMAKDLGNVIVANMVLLGAFAGLSEILSLGGLKEAVNELMRPSMKEINLRALDIGHACTR